MVLRCLEGGADGVLVLGCHIGDCHYKIGNKNAKTRMEQTRDLLKALGISEERLLLKWISASEGTLFAETCKDFVEKIKEIGPLREGSP